MYDLPLDIPSGYNELNNLPEEDLQIPPFEPIIPTDFKFDFSNMNFNFGNLASIDLSNLSNIEIRINRYDDTLSKKFSNYLGVVNYFNYVRT